MIEDTEEQADPWADYDSGPFCRHWSDPSDCEVQCGRCGVACSRHDDVETDGCVGGWVEPE